MNEPEFKDIYDKLTGLARYKRNPSAHGGAYTVFSFYLEGARHKISCTLNDKSVSVQWDNQEDNFSAMKSFFKLISTHPSTQSIFVYIKAGLNISFSKQKNTHNDMISRMSNQEIQEYIEYMTRMYDDMANMDW